MTLHRAFEIVLELAQQNIADQLDHPAHAAPGSSDRLRMIYAEQDKACDMVSQYLGTAQKAGLCGGLE